MNVPDSWNTSIRRASNSANKQLTLIDPQNLDTFSISNLDEPDDKDEEITWAHPARLESSNNTSSSTTTTTATSSTISTSAPIPLVHKNKQKKKKKKTKLQSILNPDDDDDDENESDEIIDEFTSDDDNNNELSTNPNSQSNLIKTKEKSRRPSGYSNMLFGIKKFGTKVNSVIIEKSGKYSTIISGKTENFRNKSDQIATNFTKRTSIITQNVIDSASEKIRHKKQSKLDDPNNNAVGYDTNNNDNNNDNDEKYNINEENTLNNDNNNTNNKQNETIMAAPSNMYGSDEIQDDSKIQLLDENDNVKKNDNVNKNENDNDNENQNVDENENQPMKSIQNSTPNDNNMDDGNENEDDNEFDGVR